MVPASIFLLSHKTYSQNGKRMVCIQQKLLQLPLHKDHHQVFFCMPLLIHREKLIYNIAHENFGRLPPKLDMNQNFYFDALQFRQLQLLNDLFQKHCLI